MNPAMVLTSSVFPSDAPCPDGYVLVESVPQNHSRPHTHLAHYESVSAMARGVLASRAFTLCGYHITRDEPHGGRGATWRLVSTKGDDGKPRKTTCRRCLTEIRKALA